MDLTDRKKQILKVVVEDYIRTAEPVGSKAIAAEMGGSVSSATIRNELSDLVELGYLEQPHTSAGRIPSPKGYRLYVNELMERQRLSLAETEKINQSLQMKMEELDRVISQAGRAVSSFVNYPAYVATAGKGSITASRFDLLPVDEKSCIVVMMMGDNRVKSQLLRMQLKVDRDQMAALVELLNRHFTGISIKEMNQKLMAISQGITPQLFLLLSQTVNYAVDVLEESNHREFIMAGTNQLLKLPEFRDADKAHELMSFLADDKEKLPVPDEGSNWFVDAMCVLKTAQHKEEAEAWINFIASTESNLANMDYIGYASPNLEALEGYPAYYEETYGEPLDEERYEIMAAPDDVLARCELYTNLPADTLTLYNDLWTELGI